jgi:hypothetical protein
MSYASCPTVVVNAPVEIVSALLADPVGWGYVFDVRINHVDPQGPAVAGQKIVGETGPRLFHLKLAFWVIEADAEHYRLVMDKNSHLALWFAKISSAHLSMPIIVASTTLTRVLMSREVNTGPVDSLSRLKHAAGLGCVGRTNDDHRR